MSRHSRQIRLQGAFNFRDLGGYRTRDGRSVRWRKLFRSDALHFLTHRDVEVVRDQLGVRRVVDLRSHGDVERDGVGPLVQPPVERHHAPVLTDAIMKQWGARRVGAFNSYVWMLNNGGKHIADALRVLATNSEAPAVFHCFAGKDRTGVMSAVLLGILDVDDRIIGEDYALSSEAIGHIIERGKRLNPGLVIPPEDYEVPAQIMLDVLSHVRSRYGSVQDYALSAGATQPILDQLRATLLE